MRYDLSDTQTRWLDDLARGRDPTDRLNGRSARGGASATPAALQRRGYIDADGRLTDAGRDAVGFRRCELCGVVREQPFLGTKRDHLRTCYVLEGGRRLWKGYFRPRLNDDELHRIQSRGEHTICSNRDACRQRMREGARQ